jgi:hypothetical protein
MANFGTTIGGSTVAHTRLFVALRHSSPPMSVCVASSFSGPVPVPSVHVPTTLSLTASLTVTLFFLTRGAAVPIPGPSIPTIAMSPAALSFCSLYTISLS